MHVLRSHMGLSSGSGASLGSAHRSVVPSGSLLTVDFTQDTQLYVKDPRALHHILTKEQFVFEETDMFIK